MSGFEEYPDPLNDALLAAEKLQQENNQLKDQLALVRDSVTKAFYTYPCEVNGAEVLPYRDNSGVFIEEAMEVLSSTAETVYPDWQPIKTAPTDRPFLAYQHIVVDPLDMDNFWIAEWHEGELECGAPSPTHWLPLPEPPADAIAPRRGGTASDNPTA